jgi:hypothetical protein
MPSQLAQARRQELGLARRQLDQERLQQQLGWRRHTRRPVRHARRSFRGTAHHGGRSGADCILDAQALVEYSLVRAMLIDEKQVTSAGARQDQRVVELRQCHVRQVPYLNRLVRELAPQTAVALSTLGEVQAPTTPRWREAQRQRPRRRWRSNGHAPARRGSARRAPKHVGDGVAQRGRQAFLVAHQHLRLGRVDVGIYALRRQVKLSNQQRMTSLAQQRPIACLGGGEQCAMVHGAPIDGDDDVLARAEGERTAAHRTAERESLATAVPQLHQPTRGIRAVHRADGSGEIMPWRLRQEMTIHHERKPHRGVNQRKRAQRREDPGRFDAGAREHRAAGGQRLEQLAHRDSRATRPRADGHGCLAARHQRQ